MRRAVAIWVMKLAAWLSRKLGRQGSATPGKIGLTICPSLIRDLAKQVRGELFVVCGTNGKTTTNNLLYEALRSEGKTVVCNNAGANMLYGVATAFGCAAKWTGKLDADCACIEVDEASTLRVFPHFHPHYFILTNLFRDQLDRYGEIDTTIALLKKGLALSPETKLIVNGDDPLSVSLAQQSGLPFVCFGVGEEVPGSGAAARETKEGRFCQQCGEQLVYQYYHYSQLGNYRCPQCGFSRPHIAYEATNVNLEKGIAITVEDRRIAVDYQGFYNIYNILAAYAAAREAGYPLAQFGRVLSAYRPQNGRMERFSIDGKQVMLNLAKNPAGFNQNISAVLTDPKPKDLIVAINDNSQDGEDVSWLWDVDFERFAGANVKTFTASGIRGRDMQIRFKYADLPASLSESLEAAVRAALREGTGNLYVLVNYTALYGAHVILKRMEEHS